MANNNQVSNDESTNRSELSSHPELVYIEKPKSSLISEKEQDFFDKLSVMKKRIIGISLSCFSGLMYGQAFTPVVYLGEQEHNNFLLDYLFSFYTGLYMASLFYFIIYCIVKKNKPVIYSNIILPGLISGKPFSISDIF